MTMAIVELFSVILFSSEFFVFLSGVVSLMWFMVAVGMIRGIRGKK